eukprot:gene5626-9443_t
MSKRKISLGISVGKIFGLRSPVVESNEDIVPIKTGHLSVKPGSSFKGSYTEKQAKSGSLDEETNWTVVLKIYTRDDDNFSGTLSYTCEDYKKAPMYKTEINGQFETFSQGEVEEVEFLEGSSGILKTFMIEADSKKLDLDVISANLKDKDIVLTGYMNLTKID